MKWREYPGDVLPVWVAEMDVLTPEPVAEALVGAVRRGIPGIRTGLVMRRLWVTSLCGGGGGMGLWRRGRRWCRM